MVECNGPEQFDPIISYTCFNMVAKQFWDLRVPPSSSLKFPPDNSRIHIGSGAGGWRRMAIADAWIHVICLRDWLIKKAAQEEENQEEAEIRGLASCNAGFHTVL